MTTKAEDSTKVVLLGASNLSLGWPRLADQVASAVTSPLRVYTAYGMGRSYCGERSGFACWQLPGILKSGIWDALESVESDNSDCYALITDLGNDLVYGKSPQEVVDAANECVARLRRWNSDCRIVMTRPPTASVETVGRFRFGVCRWILFPKCPLSLPEVKAATVELDGRLVELANDLQVRISEPLLDWYGLDPIHVKRRYQTTAFSRMIQHWQSEHTPTPPASAIRPNFRRRPQAEMKWAWGRQKFVDQPSVNQPAVQVFAY